MKFVLLFVLAVSTLSFVGPVTLKLDEKSSEECAAIAPQGKYTFGHYKNGRGWLTSDTQHFSVRRTDDVWLGRTSENIPDRAEVVVRTLVMNVLRTRFSSTVTKSNLSGTYVEEVTCEGDVKGPF